MSRKFNDIVVYSKKGLAFCSSLHELVCMFSLFRLKRAWLQVTMS